MNYQWVFKKSKILLFLSVFFLLLIWLSDTIYSNYKQYRFDQNQIVQRDVLVDIAAKASNIISSNNPSPIFYSTLKRIIIRSPEQSISGYIYSTNLLKIRLESNVNLFEVSKLFDYLPYKKTENDYEIQI